MRTPHLVLVAASLASGLAAVPAADTIFSGPQPGETATPFRVVDLGTPGAALERDPVAEHAGAPTAIVFVHTIERSLVPLLRVIDQYGAERKDRLRTEVVFLAADRLAGEQRVRAATSSLKLSSRVGLSLDGAEGPGNYGLNKDCMMTIVAAKENKVTANFALVQPGIADAPRVLAALARTCGDAAPPSVEELSERQALRGGGRERGARMQREGAGIERARTEPVDYSRLDLSSESGLREAVRALIVEVQGLRAELADLRREARPTPRADGAAKPAEDFPGAVPEDPKLVSLLRQFIRPTNDDATVDRVLGDVEAHIKGSADLTRQAIDGWTRILHFGDRYGTGHARKVGGDFLERLKKERAATPGSP